ncbi:ABC-2 family transporter protein [Oceanivirga salmonicida]|uniref:ABC-2 family transporter protein n=1 Tax=Oceanivirga salmonicida TaxID=1769291 RepID=UPI00082B56D4|nr:ABC-2 family transporter protein [Oceanivirga salmonicida]
MKKYYKIMINQILIKFQHRFNILSKIWINLFQFFIIYFIWKNVYTTSELSKIGDYNINEMTIYILITNLTILLYNFNDIHRIGRLVRTGKLTTILLRPISFSKENFFQYMGNKFIVMSMFLIMILISKIDYKFFVFIYVFFTIIMYYYLIAVISTIGFWIIQTWSLNGLFNGIFYILAGVYFPLDLLPKNIFLIVKYNPFSLVSYVLAKILESKIEFNQILYYMLSCIIWIIILKILYRFLLIKGLKTYEGMGA